jgi:branched-chain amino acid transport system substrate-binding protein
MLRIAMMPVMVVAEAMQRANSAEPAKYLPEMAKTNYEGVTANIKFDDKGDLQGGAITVYRVVKGNWEVLKTVGAQ